MFSYVTYYRSENVVWSVVHLRDQFMLYDFAGRHVDPLPLEVVPRCGPAPVHCVSNQPLGSLPGRYRKGASLMFDEAEQFVRDFPGRLGSYGSTCAPTWRHVPLADNGCLNDNEE